MRFQTVSSYYFTGIARLFKKVIILWLFLLPLRSYTQDTGNISGHVIDADTNTPLPGVSVYVRGTTMGGTTAWDGYYEINGLKPGEYILIAQIMGYEKQKRKVVVVDGKTTKLNFGVLQAGIQLDEVSIAAKRTDIMNEPLPMARIDAAQIRRSSPSGTSDILNELPGISTSRTGNWGSKPYFQGMTDSRILVFIDGVKTNQACPMGMDACTATIEPNMIESMEVHIGPGSSVFGSGNMGGVINVTTKSSKYFSGRKFKTDISFDGKYEGVSNARTGTLALSGGNNRIDFITILGKSIYDNYNTPEGVIENSGYSSGFGHIKFRYRPGRNHELMFLDQIYRAKDIGWPASNTIIPDEKRETYAINYRWSDIGKNLYSLKVNTSYQAMFHDMINYLPDNREYRGESKTDTYNARIAGNWLFGGKHSVVSGIEYSLWKMDARNRIVSDGVVTANLDILPKTSVGELGAYIQDEFHIGEQLLVQAGLRNTSIVSDADPSTDTLFNKTGLRTNENIFSGSLALLYNITGNSVITGALVKGIRGATPVERYIASPMIDGYFRIGNPDLVSEANLSARLGYRGMKDGFNWNVEIYRNHLSNLIEPVVDTVLISDFPDLKGTKRFVNIFNGSVTGVTASLGIYLSEKLTFNTNISYDYGIDALDGSYLPNIAPLTSFTKLTYENQEKHYWFEGVATLAGSQLNIAEKYGEIRTSGYAIFDIRGGWTLFNELELSGGVKNLFNKMYRNHLNVSQLPEPGRNVYVAIRYKIPISGHNKKKINLKTAQIVNLSIEGMACQYCVNTVTTRLEGVEGVESVRIDLKGKKGIILVDKNTDIGELLEAVQRAGFIAKLESIEPYQKQESRN